MPDNLINPVMSKDFVNVTPSVENNSNAPYMMSGVNSLEYSPYEDTVELSGESHTARNITFAVLGATALAAALDGIFAKGKHIKKIWNKITKSSPKKPPKKSDIKPEAEEIKKSAERLRLEGANTEAGEVLKGNTIFDSKGTKLRTIEDLGEGKAKITVFGADGSKKTLYSFDKEGSLVTEFDSTGKKIKDIKKDVEDKDLFETTYFYNKKGEIARTVERNCEDDTQKIIQRSSRLGLKVEETTVYKDGSFEKVKIASYDSTGNPIRVEEKQESGVIKKTIYDKDGNAKKSFKDKQFSRFGFIRDIFRV